MNPMLVIATALSVILGGQVGPERLLGANGLGLRGSVRSVQWEIARITKSSGKNVEGQRLLTAIGTYDERGNLIETVAYKRDGSVLERQVLSYDDKGNEIHQSGYDSRGSTVKKVVYSRDNAGRWTETASYDHKGNLKSRIVYIYDDAGRMSETLRFSGKGSSEGKTIFRYYSEGRMSQIIQYDRSGAVTGGTVYKFDVAANKIETSPFSAKRPSQEKTARTYDSAFRLIESLSYTPDGNLASKTTLTYNAEGDVAQEVTHSGAGISTVRNSYEYDSAANWTKEVTLRDGPGYDRSTTVGEVTYRTFTYYPGPARELRGSEPKTLADVESPSGGRGGGVLQGSAINRVQPSYPPLAKSRGETGVVVVEVTVDEFGEVLFARAVSGPSVFRSGAVEAALRWTFSPALLNGIPVKVIGTITFSFGM